MIRLLLLAIFIGIMLIFLMYLVSYLVLVNSVYVTKSKISGPTLFLWGNLEMDDEHIQCWKINTDDYEVVVVGEANLLTQIPSLSDMRGNSVYYVKLRPKHWDAILLFRRQYNWIESYVREQRRKKNKI